MKHTSHAVFADFLFLPTRKRLPAILAIYVIMGGFFGFYFDLFGHTQLAQLNQQLSQTTTEITKMRTAVINLHKIKSQQIHDEQHAITTKLTPHSLYYVFNQLTLLAQENNMEIDAIKPLPAQKTYGLITQPIAITLNSNYDQFLQFLRNLKHLPLIFSINDFRIQINSSADHENHHLNLNMIFDIYSDDTHD